MVNRHRALWIGWVAVLCVFAVGCTSGDEPVTLSSTLTVVVVEEKVAQLSDANLLRAEDIPGRSLTPQPLPDEVWDPNMYFPLSAHICDLQKFPAQSPLVDLEQRSVVILGPGSTNIEEAVFADKVSEIETAYAAVAATLQRCVENPEGWNLGLTDNAIQSGTYQTAEYLSLSGAADEGIAFTYRTDEADSHWCTHRVAVVRVSDRIAVVMLNESFAPVETFTDDDFRTIVDQAINRIST